ncbi:MAG: SMP-30/gluconolactonase/LRE family protein [Bacteroidota bacterium]
MQAELLFDARAELGEGPAWIGPEQALYWVDILKKRVFAGTDVLLQLHDHVSCVAVRRGGGLLLALGASLVKLDTPASGFTVLARVSEPATNRFNDGKCDPAGRLLAGTMDTREREDSGALYSLDPHGLTRLLSGVRISNGLAWSPDAATLYHIDTPTRQIRAFDYDLGTGQIANGRTAVTVPESFGWPDGMTSDADGSLWVAMWGGARVTKWDPRTGQLLEQFPVPALQTSSCIFGGRDLSELYITSARRGMTESQLQRYPLSGGLFRLQTRVTGTPCFEFLG